MCRSGLSPWLEESCPVISYTCVSPTDNCAFEVSNVPNPLIALRGEKITLLKMVCTVYPPIASSQFRGGFSIGVSPQFKNSRGNISRQMWTAKVAKNQARERESENVVKVRKRAKKKGIANL